MRLEEWNSDWDKVDGFIKPIPPNLAGRENSSLSMSKGALRPVRFGISLDRIMSSSGCIR